ncbi:MAG: hypothetical protein Q9187_005944 [Circinaria calcarea]
MSSKQPALSLLETLDLVLLVFETGKAFLLTKLYLYIGTESRFKRCSAIATVLTVATAPFRGASGNRDFSKHVAYGTSRYRNARASARQLQFRARGITQLGGGYVKPATTHFEFLWYLHKTSGPDLALCLLPYSLAPGGTIPCPTPSGILQYLTINAGKKPEKVILLGDSAGGNLILGIFSHLLHPLPSIERLQLSGPLRGAALISPLGDFSTVSPTYARNRYKDLVDALVLEKWAACFMGIAEADEYNQPFRASSGWWKDLRNVVRDVLITAGADEVCVG